MTERFRFFDALTYGVRTLFWRPVRAVAYIIALSLMYAAYSLWAQSDAGVAFFTGYMQSITATMQGDYSSYGRYLGSVMGVSLITGCLMIAGAYRVYLRDEPAASLPIRLGLDELRTLGVYLLLMLIGLGIMILIMILVMIVMMAVVFIAAGMGVDFSATDPAQAGPTVLALMLGVMLPVLLAEIYVFGRLMVGFGLAIRDRRFRLGGWKASRGAGLQLLWAHVALYLVLICVVVVLSPEVMTMVRTAMTDPAAMQDPAVLSTMTNPYGGAAWLAMPLVAAMTFLMFGPTAAVASWDARKRAAAGAAAAPAATPSPAPVNGPAAGVGTGEAGD